MYFFDVSPSTNSQTPGAKKFFSVSSPPLFPKSQKNFFAPGFRLLVEGGPRDGERETRLFFGDPSIRRERAVRARKYTSSTLPLDEQPKSKRKKKFFFRIPPPSSSQNPKKFFCAWISAVRRGGKAKTPTFSVARQGGGS